MGITLRRARGLMGRVEGKILFLTETFSICSEMLNAIYERKSCNRFVIIPRRNTSSIPRINWGSFRGRYHFGVDLGTISGLGIILGSGSFWGLYKPRAYNGLFSEIHFFVLFCFVFFVFLFNILKSRS